MTILKNPSIPSTMTADGLEFLGRMARSVPENGVIVEIGPLFGSSTWVLAKNAHPSVKVFSIDTWAPDKWIEKVENNYRNCRPFSKEAFLHYTRDCPNVTAIQGWSPEIVKDWDLPIDLFFDDATHGDPGFSENMNFFLPFVKPGALLCGDDYSSGWPDIVRVVDRLSDGWGLQPEVSGRVWAIRKPNPKEITQKTVYSSLPSPQRNNSVSIYSKTMSGAEYELSDEVWSGAIHKHDRLVELKLTENFSTSGLSLVWHIELSSGRQVGPFISSDTISCLEDEWINGLSIKLEGTSSRQYSLEYQASFCWHTGRGKRYPVSTMHRNGELLKSDDRRIAITGVRIKLVKKTDVMKRKVRSFIATLKYMKLRVLLGKLKRQLKFA